MRSQNMPGPGIRETIQLIRGFKANTLESHEQLFSQYGDYVGLSAMGQKAVFIYHPDGVQRILKSNYKNYIKGEGTYELKHVMGTGLFTTESEDWLKLRKIHAPEFHHKRVEGNFEIIHRHVQETLTRWRGKRDYFDVVPEMSLLAFGIVSESLFGTDLRAYFQLFSEIEGPMSNYINDRMYGMNGLFNWPLWMPVPANSRFKRNLKKFDEVVHRIIAQIPPPPGHDSNLLARLSEAKTLGCPMFDLKGLRDQISTALVAAYDTTSYALSWALYNLAIYPEIQGEMRDELNAKVSGEVPTLDEVKKLELTLWIFLESMRLFPPSPSIDRKALQDDEIGGYPVQAGSTVEGFLWVTHRHPEFWPDPLSFRPRRFEPSEAAKHHPFAYFPFSGGPRQCIGEPLVMLEAITALAAFIKNFKLELDESRRPIPRLAVTLRPDPGVYIRAVEQKRPGR